jgi:4-hydroxybenzoate polyprenyltransferase
MQTTIPRLSSDSSADDDGALPLIVDVDGALLRTDLLWEGLLQMSRDPFGLWGLLRTLPKGKATLKAFVEQQAPLSAATLPREDAVLSLIERTCAAGRPVALVSGAHEAHLEPLRQCVGALVAWGSDGVVNLTGWAKLERIQAHFARFDYVGNAAADIPVWAKARRAYAVNAGPITLWRARRVRPDLIVLGSGRAPGLAAIRALRPHQWAKNLLLLLPVLAAHVPWSLALGLQMLAGFVALSLAASFVYITNDLIDLPHDRRHATKRRRPFAAGELSIPSGVALATGLAALSAALTIQLPKGFQGMLVVYLALTISYSCAVKRWALLDVITLATLYTTRVVAGAALAEVPVTRWFLAFSVFFFLSLALVKRVVELRDSPGAATGQLAGRGYVVADVPVLTGLGVAATAASALVYCLYIAGDEVRLLYSRPDLLWAGLPILLYWQARVWLLTGRNAMEEDPVVFAIRDRVSHLAFAIFLAVMMCAV